MTHLHRIIGYLAATLVELAMAGAFGAVSQDANGWTVVTASGDSRIIYVSSSDGNDADDGLSEANAKATVAAGKALLRNGYPDHILFKRGDTWTNENFGNITVRGRSATEPMLFGAYGTGVRPKFFADPATDFANLVNEVEYVYFIGIAAEPNDRETNGGNTTGIRIVAGAFGGNFLIEDCFFRGFATNFNLTATAPSGPNYWSDLTVRRNIIADAWASSDDSHSQGIFISKPQGVLIEENIFDHNGWHKNWHPDNGGVGLTSATGTTAAYTNGDTLTFTAVADGVAIGEDGNGWDIILVDSNDSSGAVGSVTVSGDDITITADLTSGVGSDVIAAAVTAYNGGADWTATSSGTADIVAADAGTQLNVTAGGGDAGPTIFNHNIYISERTRNITIRRNVFSRGSSMGTKVDVIDSTHTIEDNLYVGNGMVGQFGVGSADVEVEVDGCIFNIANNVMIEGVPRAQNNTLGPSFQNIVGGYFRNNILASRADAGTGGWALDFGDHSDGRGINSFTIDSNVVYDWRSAGEFEDPEPTFNGNNYTQHAVSGNTLSNNIFVAGDTATAPLFNTDWTSSAEMTYSGNQYYHPGATATDWFDIDGSAVSQATFASTVEAGADFTEPTFTDATRDVTDYVTDVLSGTDIDDLRTSWDSERNGNWNSQYHAPAINDYIRAGFDVSEYTPSSARKVMVLQ